MDKVTNKVATHVAEQQTTQQEQQQGINNAAPTESSSSQSSTSAEQSAATYAMFTQGAKNGGAASSAAQETVNQEKQVETKEPPKAETQGITSTGPTDEELKIINGLQTKVIQGVLTKPNNFQVLLNLKNSDAEERANFLLEINSKIGALNLIPNEKLLLEHLLNATTKVCMIAWPQVLPAAIVPDENDNRDVLIKGVVLSDLVEQIKQLIDLHNIASHEYIQMLGKCQNKQALLEKVANFTIKLNQLAIGEIRTLKNLLDSDVSEAENTQGAVELSQQGQMLFDDILEYYGTLSEEDRLGASSGILAGIKDRISKN